MQNLTIDKNLIYSYLGYNKDMLAVSESLDKQIDDCINKVISCACLRKVYSKKLTINFDNFSVENMCLLGNDIKAHLKDCDKVILMAVTLGSNVDSLIKKAELLDITSAVIMDAVSNVLIEKVADIVENEVRENLAQKGEYLTSRFSPGYGDLPLDMQKNLLSLLNAEKRVGITLTSTNLMIPRKSITAILGVSNKEVKGKLAGCNHCLLKDKCDYRKRGITCDK